MSVSCKREPFDPKGDNLLSELGLSPDEVPGTRGREGGKR
jgi:hypothetical protein